MFIPFIGVKKIQQNMIRNVHEKIRLMTSSPNLIAKRYPKMILKKNI